MEADHLAMIVLAPSRQLVAQVCDGICHSAIRRLLLALEQQCILDQPAEVGLKRPVVQIPFPFSSRLCAQARRMVLVDELKHFP